MYRMKLVATLFLAMFLSVCSPIHRDTGVEMRSIAVFDPVKYAGLWYEIARFETPFQAGCFNTQAEYRVVGEGQLSVRNSCFRNGSLSVIGGRAELSGPGRLRVKLDGVPFSAPYWVLWVDDAYQTAVVGVPSGRAGWILNRTPNIPADRLKAAEDVLAFNGYDISALRMTVQEGAQ